jgi:DNA-binding response OmpR family regulator
MHTPLVARVPPLRMLLIDREAAIRFAIGDYFAGLGFEVDVAGSPADAEAWLARHSYAIALLDLELRTGAHDGLRLAERIRLLAPGTITCLLAPPLSAAETQAASRTADVVITRPRPLPDIAQLIFALLPGETQSAPKTTASGHGG